MSAVIRAAGFDNFRQALADATDEQVTATEAYWADRTGSSAATHRELVCKEVEFRQAVAHDIDTAHAALVSAMAPPTRWEARR
ncbi:hypothetical protein [Micromonospora chokoriensis]|uniref:hypothetical protein n=1 Tax=Micromonospora chokoriensis TaxID=356851 RepID=UPI0004C349AF|nr:hypothetical protein [Micromonospora chokoriensis]